MKILTWLVCFLILGFCSCTSRKTVSSNLAEDLDAFFSSSFKPKEPGASVLIVKNNEVVFSKSYGLADLDTKEPISSKTLFNLGSISKTFVAYGILMLRDQGKLSLDDPLSKYFSDFNNREIAEKVTLLHLLTHTSGLPDSRMVWEDSVFYLTAKDAENWEPIKQTEALNFQPGERYEYSNPAFNALALVIEQVSGMKWQAYIEENIFTPSGMTTSTITDGPHPEHGVAHGYIRIAGEWHEKDYGEEPTFAAAGNGGVWSSIEELAKYELAIQQALFVKKETVDESRTVVVPENWKDISPPFIGKSWFIEQTPDNLEMATHTGTQGGFYCDYMYVPAKHVLYVILANRPFEREQSREKILLQLKENNWME
jgi:CubicO group peptidase (beta-lactamase class C family)